MSKAILVMDMPENCADCPLRNSLNIDHVICHTTLKSISDSDYYAKRPDWCPLRELPERKEQILKDCTPQEALIFRENKGWNDCIDTITGTENPCEKNN